MNPILSVSGWKLLSVEKEHSAAFLNVLFSGGFEFTDFRASEEGLSVRCSSRASKKILAACRKRDIPVRVLRAGGVPRFFRRYRKRGGMFLGLFIAAALVVLSGRFVWDVRVTGNSTMTASEVRGELRRCGFGVGSYIPLFDARAVENRVLMESDRIAWISVYVSGTVATVQIRENRIPPADEPARPANLIATADGQVELFELYRGNPVVSIGDAVRKGELLVSGVYDSQSVGYRCTRAAGKVLARTERDFHVEIPLVYEEKRYLGRKRGDLVLNFFDFSLKILKTTGNEGESCDIIEREFDWDLPGHAPLPVSVGTTSVLPYEYRTATRSAEEALDLAYRQLERELAAFADGDTQMLDKRVTTTVTDASVILDCRVTSVENIAAQQEFDYTELP